MAAEVVPYFLPQFFDNNGKPLAGGKVYTYKAGTTTPITTYKDASFTPNENPIILDSAGRASIYVGIQPVKFVICDADDNVIETRDHVSGASSTAVGIQTVVPIETDGVKTEFDLGIDPELPQNCTVVLVTSGGDRITFLTSEYTVNGTKIIFNSPPPAGTGEVRIGATRAIASSGLSDGSVSTPKLQDRAVTNAKLADNSVGTSKIQDEAVTEPKIADAAIVTRHLSAGSVTNDKRAPLGQVVSSSSSSFSTQSNTYVDVPNLQVTINATGRPIFIGFVGDTASRIAFERGLNKSSVSAGGRILLLKNNSPLHEYIFGSRIGFGNETNDVISLTLPCSVVWYIDTSPGIGPVTYKIQAHYNGSAPNEGIARVSFLRLVAFEL